MLHKEFKKQGDFLFRYRGSLPLIILFLALGVLILTRLTKENNDGFFHSQTYPFICFGIAFSGQIIRILTVGYTPLNTSGRNKYKQVADEINTTGIYSLVRHPLYLGNFFMWLGIALLTGNFWFVLSFVLFYWIYYERIMYAEEMFLFDKFGKAYEDWAEKTPAFIPSFRNYKKPKLPFSWKKILKKEKNGINAIFVLMFLFDFTANSVVEGRLIIHRDFWFYAVIVSLVFYFTMKFFKWKTKLLDEEGR